MNEPCKGFSPATKLLLKRLREKQELTTKRCIACDGSGVSSRGYPCVPCNGKGQIVTHSSDVG